jgi:hypothetical protein
LTSRIYRPLLKLEEDVVGDISLDRQRGGRESRGNSHRVGHYCLCSTIPSHSHKLGYQAEEEIGGKKSEPVSR